MGIKFRLVTRNVKTIGGNEQKMTYALKLPSRRASIYEVAELIGERSAMSRGDVLSVLENLGWACKIIMRSGASVSLPHFGSISSTIRSKAAKDGEKWTHDRLQTVSLHFTPAPELRDALQRVSFECIRDKAEDAPADPSTPTTPSTGGGGDEKDEGEEEVVI